MPLVVIQTTIPGTDAKPFRITEVLGRVAESAEEALDIAAVHIGGGIEETGEYLTARWHETGRYWVVSYEPLPETEMRRPVLMM